MERLVTPLYVGYGDVPAGKGRNGSTFYGVPGKPGKFANVVVVVVEVVVVVVVEVVVVGTVVVVVEVVDVVEVVELVVDVVPCPVEVVVVEVGSVVGEVDVEPPVDGVVVEAPESPPSGPDSPVAWFCLTSSGRMPSCRDCFCSGVSGIAAPGRAPP